MGNKSLGNVLFLQKVYQLQIYIFKKAMTITDQLVLKIKKETGNGH